MAETCDHLWVAGGLRADWVCEHCGATTNLGEESCCYGDDYHDSPCYCMCHGGFIETDPSRP